MMLWDCSWVQNNIINGKDYGAHALELLRSYGIPPLVTTRLQSTDAPYRTTQRPTTPKAKTTKKVPTSKQSSTPTTATSSPPLTTGEFPSLVVHAL